MDVPRYVYEEAVEETKRLNAIPEDERIGVGSVTVEQYSIEMIDLEIRYFVGGEQVDVGEFHREDANGDG